MKYRVYIGIIAKFISKVTGGSMVNNRPMDYIYEGIAAESIGYVNFKLTVRGTS